MPKPFRSLFVSWLRQALLIMMTVVCIGGSVPARAADFNQSEISTLLLMKDLGLDAKPEGEEFRRISTQDADLDSIEVDLNHPQVGEVHLLLRGPHGFARSGLKYPTLLVATGIATGKESIALASRLPGVVIVGIDYPEDINTFLQDPQRAFQFLRRTPGTISLGLKWLSQQKWVDGHGPMAMGISLGGIFLPVALRIASHLGVQVQHTVFAFTGSNLMPIMQNNLQAVVPANVLGPLMQLVSTLTYLHDPAVHAPFLTGDFLVIRGDHDQTIPAAATDQLFSLLPNQKESVTLHSGHIGSDQPVTIEQTQAAVLTWLQQR